MPEEISRDRRRYLSVSVSGYLIGSPESGKLPLPPQAELQWWYQFYFATERGRAGYEKYRHDFAKLIWQLASPKWNFDDATFDRTAAAPAIAVPTITMEGDANGAPQPDSSAYIGSARSEWFSQSEALDRALSRGPPR